MSVWASEPGPKQIMRPYLLHLWPFNLPVVLYYVSAFRPEFLRANYYALHPASLSFTHHNSDLILGFIVGEDIINAKFLKHAVIWMIQARCLCLLAPVLPPTEQQHGHLGLTVRLQQGHHSSPWTITCLFNYPPLALRPWLGALPIYQVSKLLHKASCFWFE